ncbi:hypothetical protein Misp03_59240 [Microbispora sp. NBRC 16548]|nr:hypothetical protein Misp03_59240 [Microbispora sp. NBRC 16548]
MAVSREGGNAENGCFPRVAAGVCPVLSRRELLSLKYGGRNGPTVRARQHFRSIAAHAAPTARPFRPSPVLPYDYASDRTDA